MNRRILESLQCMFLIPINYRRLPRPFSVLIANPIRRIGHDRINAPRIQRLEHVEAITKMKLHVHQTNTIPRVSYTLGPISPEAPEPEPATAFTAAPHPSIFP